MWLDDIIASVQNSVASTDSSTVDHHYLQDLMNKLDGDAQSLTSAAQIIQLGPDRMGASAKGRAAAAHTDLAHGHVVKGIKQNQTALRHYSGALGGFTKNMTDADAGAQTALATLHQATAATGQQLYDLNTPSSDPVTPDPTTAGHPGVS